LPTFDKSAAARAVETMGFSANNRRFAQYWLSAWKNGAPPTRGDLSPAKIKDLLPGLAILEFDGKDSTICRLAGSAIPMAVGLDPTGLDIVVLTPVQYREERIARYRKVAGGAISRCVRRVMNRYDQAFLLEDVQLPLSGGANGAAAILYHADWRPETMDRTTPEILRGLGMVVQEAVTIVVPEQMRAAG